MCLMHASNKHAGKDGKKIKKKERDEILGELMTGGKGGAAGTAAAAAQGAGHQQQAAVAAGPKPGAAQVRRSLLLW